MNNAALTFLLLASLNAAAPGAKSSPEVARLADEVRGKGWIVFPARSQQGDWDLGAVLDLQRKPGRQRRQGDRHQAMKRLVLFLGLCSERILARGWLTRGPVKHDRLAAPVKRLGDIPWMSRSPGIENRMAPESVACTQVIRRDTGAPYADDPASEALVLGDSFLRIYQQDEPGHAGFVAHLGRALGRPLASIINDGGASTLVRQELFRRPHLLSNKKVVVWEFVERDLRLGTEGWQRITIGGPLPKNATPPPTAQRSD